MAAIFTDWQHYQYQLAGIFTSVLLVSQYLLYSHLCLVALFVQFDTHMILSLMLRSNGCVLNVCFCEPCEMHAYCTQYRPLGHVPPTCFDICPPPPPSAVSIGLDWCHWFLDILVVSMVTNLSWFSVEFECGCRSDETVPSYCVHSYCCIWNGLHRKWKYFSKKKLKFI